MWQHRPPSPALPTDWVPAFLSLSISSLCVTDTNFAYISWLGIEQISENQKQQISLTHVFNFETINVVIVYYSIVEHSLYNRADEK
jgi:hypothetical protein